MNHNLIPAGPREQWGCRAALQEPDRARLFLLSLEGKARLQAQPRGLEGMLRAEEAAQAAGDGPAASESSSALGRGR